MSTNKSRELRKLKGKVVEKILLNRSWNEEQREWAYNPSIHFTDGSSISFYNNSDDLAGVNYWINLASKTG